MKIGILTTNNGDAEDIRLMETAQKLGYEADLLHVLNCSLSVCPNSPEVYYEGKPIGRAYDIILPRFDMPGMEYGMTILRQFQSMHVYTSETALSLDLVRDKLRCTQRLLREDVPFPATGFAYSKADYDNIIDTVGGVPLIIKLVKGTEGTGVFLADDMKHAVNLLKTFKQFSAPLIVQKFIEESAGKDIRVYVVGEKVMGAVKRESTDGDFRANIALGGKGINTPLTEEEQDIVIRSTKAVGMNVAGVDLIRSNEGALILEINGAPDFVGEELEVFDDVDIATEIIKFVVEDFARNNTEEILLKRAV